MTDQTSKLVLFEFCDEVKKFENFCHQNKIDTNEFLIVALQPRVRSALIEKKMTYLDTSAFFDNHSHQRILQKSHQLTQLIEQKLFQSIDIPLKNTLLNTFLYYSRFYLNNYIRLIEVIKGVMQKYKITEIYSVEADERINLEKSQNAATPFLINKDRFQAGIIQGFCQENQLDFRMIPSPPVGPFSDKKYPSLKPGSLFIRRVLKPILHKNLKNYSKAKIVLFAGLSYNLDRLCDEVTIKKPLLKCVTVTLDNRTFKGYLKIFFKELAKMVMGRPPRKDLFSIPLEVFCDLNLTNESPVLKQLREAYWQFNKHYKHFFTYDNCSFANQWGLKVEGDLLNHLDQVYRLSQGQLIILENLKPKLVISPLALGYFQSWGELCKGLSIPALVVPQKGLVAPQNKYAQIEEHYIGRVQVTDDYQFVASQTPLVSSYLKWAGYKGEIIETGNLIFSDIEEVNNNSKRQISPLQKISNKKVIIFAPSMKSRKSQRFFVIETLDELLLTIKDIIDVVTLLKGSHLIIRIHPGEPITRKELDAAFTLHDNISISDQGTFEDVLSGADLLISYSSTSIQEALLNRIPVILYDRWKRYNHLNAVSVKDGTPNEYSCAYYIDQKDSLLSSLRWILDKQNSDQFPMSAFKDFAYPESYKDRFFHLVDRCCEVGDEKRTG